MLLLLLLPLLILFVFLLLFLLLLLLRVFLLLLLWLVGTFFLRRYYVMPNGKHACDCKGKGICATGACVGVFSWARPNCIGVSLFLFAGAAVGDMSQEGSDEAVGVWADS